MKKNMMVIGMLVALLTIPANMFAQEVVSTNTALAAQDTTVVKVKKEKKVREPREPRVQVIDSLHYSRGSVVSAYFGFGTSGLWAQNGTAKLQNSWGFPGFSVGARYSYFFLDWLGFTTGLDYSTYTSTITMKGVYENTGLKTNMGYSYKHRLNFTGEGDNQSTWKEVEDLGMIEIPIALSFRYKPNKVGLISTVGLKMAFPVQGRYSYSGTLNRYGWSDQLEYLQQKDQYMTANDSYNETYKEYKKGTWSIINAEVFGEIGALFQVHERVDLSVSVYGGYCMNDVNRTNYTDRQDLGFRTAELAGRAPQLNASAMPKYEGLVGTKAIDHINPWNFGVKVGVHIYCANENDKERAARLAKVDIIRDTVVMKEIVRDTIEKEVIIRDTIRERYEQLGQMLGSVIIYYKVGDSKHPIVKPENILDEVAKLMVANPKLRVMVKGSASPDGSRKYNEMLSENRAHSLASILRKKGVSDKQIDVVSEVSTSSNYDASRNVEIIPLPLEK